MQSFEIALFGVLGLALGSFLNVCIDRLPGGRSIVKPPSECDSCHRRLSAGDLIPLLSYLWLRGRCRYCQAAIPRRVFVVELVTGAALALLCWRYGLTAEFGVIGLWAVVFIVVFFIDLEQGLILNVLVYPAIGVALLLAWLVEPPWLEGWVLAPVVSSAVGGAVGLAMFWLIVVFSRGGMGWGDVKLAALIGLICGFPLVLLALILGAVLGGLAALGLLLVRRRRWASGQTIPFGPSLAVATMATILWGSAVGDWYLDLL
ncbi:MAG: prepilin peptidase [Chloroflexi bacterium]|nr:prepilin peptidase [Chloroflexota bacterium]